MRIFSAVFGLLLIPFLAAGQSIRLERSVEPAIVDGTIEEGEYSFVKELDNLKLHINWAEATLYVALSANTKGWIAYGLGSLRMDGANIFIGYVQGEQSHFRADLGRGHRHSQASLEEQGIKLYSLSERDGITVMETALSSSEYISSDTAELSFIIAYGGSDDFTSKHRYRVAFEVGLGGT